jgi:hypothetical protein
MGAQVIFYTRITNTRAGYSLHLSTRPKEDLLWVVKSEETKTVHMSRHTQHEGTGYERWLVSTTQFEIVSLANLHGVWHYSIAHLESTEVSIMSQLHLQHQMHTARYRMDMSDQRFICPKSFVLSRCSSDGALRLPISVQTIKLLLVRWLDRRWHQPTSRPNVSAKDTMNISAVPWYRYYLTHSNHIRLQQRRQLGDHNQGQ